MWGWEEKAACSYTHAGSSVHLLSPVGGAGSSSVCSRHPRADGVSEDLQAPPQTVFLKQIALPVRRPPAHSPRPCLPDFGSRMKPRPAPEPLPEARPQPRPQRRLSLPGFWYPQGHTALSGNYSSGQLSLAFLSSESCIFLPIFGGDLVAGQPSRECAGGSTGRAWLCFPELSLPAPQSLKGPQGDHQGWMRTAWEGR